MSISLLNRDEMAPPAAAAYHCESVKNIVLHAAERLLSRSLLGEELLNVMVQTQLELLRHESREQILSFLHDFLRFPALVNPSQHEAIYAIAYCLIEDTCEPHNLSDLALSHRHLSTGMLAEVQAIGLRYLVLVYWRSNRFKEASDVFAVMAAQLDRRPCDRGLWHLCTLVSVICNDEQQHRMARRFSMQALGCAQALEESCLIDRAEYGYSNSLSLSQLNGSSADCFASLRALVQTQRANLDPVLEFLVLVGSGRDSVHQGKLSQANHYLAQAKERSANPRVGTRYLMLVEQARVAHFKDQTLIRDSKLEEMRWLEERYPSRLLKRAKKHLFADIKGASHYHIADGDLTLLPREAANELKSISARCHASVRLAEQYKRSEA